MGPSKEVMMNKYFNVENIFIAGSIIAIAALLLLILGKKNVAE